MQFGVVVLAFFAIGAIEPFKPARPIDMAGNQINNLAAATSNNDAIRKVDAQNASNLASGTVPDARLSANVSLLGSSIDLSGSEATGTLADARFPSILPAISGENLTGLTKTQVGLANVTNDTQTKSAIVPNTAPSAGQVLVGNAGGTAYAPASLSGDATLSSTGALTLGTVSVGKGGTGQTSFTNGQLLIGNTTGNTLTKATLTAGSGITVTNGGGSITVAATAVSASFETLTDGATVTLPWVDRKVAQVTLGGNRTLAISGTPAVGESVILRLKQDATGGRTITWPSSGVTINWPLGNASPVLGTTASRTDTFQFICVDATVGALVFSGITLSMNEGP